MRHKFKTAFLYYTIKSIFKVEVYSSEAIHAPFYSPGNTSPPFPRTLSNGLNALNGILHAVQHNPKPTAGT